jgi:hypothetical protein
VNQARELAVQIRQLEEQLAVAQAVSVKDQAQIARLIDALEESAAALDMELQVQHTEQNSQQDGRSITTEEHNRLTNGLGASEGALTETIVALQREIKALAAERDAATVRERICQTELDYLRQRRVESANAAYSKLLADNEALQRKVENLEVQIRAARSSANQDELIQALVREITLLKGTHDHQETGRLKSLERRVDRAARRNEGSKNQTVIVQGEQVRSQAGSSSGNQQKRVYHRRSFVAAQDQGTLSTTQGPARINIMVQVDRTPTAQRLGIAGESGWLRFGRDAVEFVTASNQVRHTWNYKKILNSNMMNADKVSFNSHAPINLLCKHPHLAQKVNQEMQRFVSTSAAH